MLLTVTIVALTIGWVVDRNARERRHQEDLEDAISSGSFRSDEAWTAISTAKAHKSLSRDEFEDWTKGKLAWAMFVLWRYEKKINNAIDDESPSAIALANEILTTLECDTTKEYLQLAAEYMPDNGENLWPELHDLDSEKHESFKAFLQRAAATNSTIEW